MGVTAVLGWIVFAGVQSAHLGMVTFAVVFAVLLIGGFTLLYCAVPALYGSMIDKTGARYLPALLKISLTAFLIYRIAAHALPAHRNGHLRSDQAKSRTNPRGILRLRKPPAARAAGLRGIP